MFILIKSLETSLLMLTHCCIVAMLIWYIINLFPVAPISLLFTTYFNKIAPTTGNEEKQMVSKLIDVVRFCFLSISIGWGADDGGSPLIGEGYRLADEKP